MVGNETTTETNGQLLWASGCGGRQQFLDAEHDLQQHLPISAAARVVSLLMERSDRR
jgi:hypothetical protein